jgi:tRNA (Thr-GGU) A37 N-methylase
MQPEIVMTPIGQVGGGRTQPVDDSWEAEEAIIELDSRFSPAALAGVSEFSHVHKKGSFQ